jgi:uncharacterized protein (UPF0212 family)
MPKKNLDLSFLIQGTEEIELPSKGLLYKDGDFVKGKVHVRPWLTTEEKLIDKFTRGNFYSILKKLVQNVMEEKTSVEEMTVSDFFYVLYIIRAMSYGPIYYTDTECPICEAKIQSKIDLSKYKTKYLEPCAEPFTMTLPKSRIEIKFRLPRVKDLIEATEKTHSEALKFGVNVSPDIFKLARCVEEMVLNNVERDILTQEEDFDTMLYKIWPKLPAIDAAAIREEMSKYDHGYVTNEMTKCPSCENNFEQAPVLSFEFFRPSSTGTSDDSGPIIDI